MRLTLLGSVKVHWDEGSPPRFRSQRTVALLGYLVAEARPFSREHLAALFWPDEDPSKGKANLRRELHNLTQILPGCWQTSRVKVEFVPGEDTAVDILQFRQYEVDGQWQKAADLVGGNFLEGIVLADNLEFETWLLGEQERWRQRSVHMLQTTVDEFEKQGAFQKALRYAQRLLQLMPWQEETQRQVMQLLALMGRRSEALKQFEECQRALQRELGIDVSAETLALQQRIILNANFTLHNLPGAYNSFFGRSQELEQLVSWLSGPTVRLITITGPGGVGKTRLALAIAEQFIDASRLQPQAPFSQGIYFVDLAPLSDPEQIISAITVTLGLKFQSSSDESTRQQVLDYLQNKQMLLIIDNFEHLLNEAGVVRDILAAAPAVKILVTSRERLNLQGEHNYPLSPLLLPDLNESLTQASLAGFPSISLFAERAKAVNPDFEITDGNAHTLATICARLDGLPLALELAAAWNNLVSFEELLSRLDRSLDLLRGGPQDLPPRQQTLRATVQWSFELLPTKERALLLGLSVFAGGHTLEAAEAVLATTQFKAGAGFERSVTLRQQDILPGLAALFNKSLILRDRKSEHQTRYTMLGTIREYATEQLAAMANSKPLQQKHAAYYLSWAEAAAPELRGPKQQSFLKQIEAEYNNLRFVLRWSLEQGVVETGLRLCGALTRFWAMSSRLTEGRKWLAETLAQIQTIQSKETLPASIIAAKANALNGAGYLAHAQGDAATAQFLCEKSLVLWQGLEAAGEFGRASTLHNLGLVAQDKGDYDLALAQHKACLAFSQRLGDQVGIYISLFNMAEVAATQGNYERAASLHNKSLTLKRANNDTWSISFSLTSLARLAVKQQDYNRAKSLFQESLRLRQQLGYTQGIAASMAGLAGVARLLGQSQRAVLLFGVVEKLLDTVGATLSPQAQDYYDCHLEAIHSQLENGTFADLWTAGQSLPLEQAIHEAMTM